MDSRWLINASIYVLTFFILVLSGGAAWHVWEDYRAAREVSQANAMADTLVEAAGIQAMERGLSAAALGAASHPDAGQGARIAALREQGDARWRQAMDMARTLRDDLPAKSELAEKFTEVGLAQADLVRARARLDACLAGQPCALDGAAWIQAATRFIDHSALLWEAAFLSLNAPGQMAQLNLNLKRLVWTASEYAGRERGTLAWYVAARQPLSASNLEELAVLRGIVEHGVHHILELKRLHHTDLRILAAIAGMERRFLNDYEFSREEVYAAANTGAYPYSATEWLRQASLGIDSLLAVSTAVSRVADEQAARSMRECRFNLFLLASIGSLALGLALASVVWVRRTANALFRQKELAEVTLHSIGDAVITTDAEARVDYLNPMAEEMTGWTGRAAMGRPLAEVFQVVDGHTRQPEPNPIEASLRENRVVGLAGNTVLISRAGIEYAIEDSAAPIRDRDGRVVGGVLVFYDVLRAHHGPHLLGYHASHDPVTGLINRREFERRLCEFRVRARASGERHALCYLDLDQFKVVNDTCGHGAGDQLLKQVAARLAERVRESDILARLGGDEFGLLLAHCPLERAIGLAEQARDAVGQIRFDWDGKSFNLHASIGLVPIDMDSLTPADLLAQADAACHVAKQKGRNRVQVYQASDLDMARRHGEMQWIARLTRALEEDRFELYCQPIVPLNGGSRHYEVLLRLRDEAGHLVPPVDFIPAAERYDLMPAIDRWVIRHALANLARRRAAGAGDGGGICGLNVSGASLGDEDFEDFLRGQFAEHGIAPAAVCLEITETAAVANLGQAGALIRSLRTEGFRFALDDFGSGLSSFMYLKNLPVDYLKIDGSFVRAMVDDRVAGATVLAIHTMASTIGIASIAEYVENDIILDRLREMGVDYAQGYGVGRPMPWADYFRDVDGA